MAAKERKASFKVIGFAATNGDRDIEVQVKASGIEEAKTEAAKKEPALAKHKDLRVYKQQGWSRVA